MRNKSLNIDMKGMCFSRLTVLEHLKGKLGGNGYCICVCSCNDSVMRKVSSNKLLCGETKSCGCLSADLMKERFSTHKMSSKRIYKTWVSIKGRCYNTKDNSYYKYGGRGIKMCDRWFNSFINFFQDMGERPTPNHSIDRIDNNGNYEPNNCRWATTKEQSDNKRNTKKIFFKNKEWSILDFTKEIGGVYGSVRVYINHKTPEEICDYYKFRTKINQKLVYNA